MKAVISTGVFARDQVVAYHVKVGEKAMLVDLKGDKGSVLYCGSKQFCHLKPDYCYPSINQPDKNFVSFLKISRK